MSLIALDPALEAGIDHAVSVLRGRSVAVLTGAGVSTDSGIPDYRGEGAPKGHPHVLSTVLGLPLAPTTLLVGVPPGVVSVCHGDAKCRARGDSPWRSTGDVWGRHDPKC